MVPSETLLRAHPKPYSVMWFSACVWDGHPRPWFLHVSPLLEAADPGELVDLVEVAEVELIVLLWFSPSPFDLRVSASIAALGSLGHCTRSTSCQNLRLKCGRQRPGTTLETTLCTSLRSRHALGHCTRSTLSKNLEVNCRNRPAGAP